MRRIVIAALALLVFAAGIRAQPAAWPHAAMEIVRLAESVQQVAQ